MGLRWRIDNIRDYEIVCYIDVLDHRGDTVKKLAPLTESLIWRLMGVGIGEITEKTAREFYARVKLLEALDGPSVLLADGTPQWVSPQDVFKHIGMFANVSNETRTAFLKRTIPDRMSAWERDFDRILEGVL